jgi:transposase-like protein
MEEGAMASRAKTRERMRALVARWRRSGESQAAFARRHGIDPQRLSYWKRVLGREQPVADRGRAVASFVPVRLVGLDGAMPSGTIEVVLGAECRLVVREGVSRELLREVLSVLRQAC